MADENKDYTGYWTDLQSATYTFNESEEPVLRYAVRPIPTESLDVLLHHYIHAKTAEEKKEMELNIFHALHYPGGVQYTTRKSLALLFFLLSATKHATQKDVQHVRTPFDFDEQNIARGILANIQRKVPNIQSITQLVAERVRDAINPMVMRKPKSIHLDQWKYHSEHSFLSQNLDAINEQTGQTIALHEIGERFLVSGRDTITVLNEDETPYALLVKEKGSDTFTVIPYEKIPQHPEVTLAEVSEEVCDTFRIFHQPEFFESLQEKMPMIEHISIRAQIQILEYILAHGLENIAAAWNFLLQKYSPYDLSIAILSEEDEQNILHFFEAFSVLEYDMQRGNMLIQAAQKEGSEDIFHEIYSITNSAREIFSRLQQSYEGLQKNPPTEREIYNTILRNTWELLAQYNAHPKQKEKIIQQLGEEGQKVQFINALVRSLSPEERRNLKIENIALLSCYRERGAEFAKKEVFSIYQNRIQEVFPPGDGEDFGHNIKSFSDVYAIFLEQQFLFGICIDIREEEIHMDWMVTGDKKTVRGISGAGILSFLIDKIKHEHPQKKIVAIAKPWVRESAKTMSEKGFLVTRIIGKNEGCKHNGYLRFEYLPNVEFCQRGDSILLSCHGKTFASDFLPEEYSQIQNSFPGVLKYERKNIYFIPGMVSQRA